MQKDEEFLFEQDHRGFDGWLRGSAIVAALLTVAIIATVFARGPLWASPPTATAKGMGAGPYFTSSTKPRHSSTDETDRSGFGSSSNLWVLH